MSRLTKKSESAPFCFLNGCIFVIQDFLYIFVTKNPHSDY